MTSASIAHRPETSAPVGVHYPAGCDLADAARCWLRHERQLRADATTATVSRSPDAEVLRADLRAAERHIDALLTIALGWAA